MAPFGWFGFAPTGNQAPARGSQLFEPLVALVAENAAHQDTPEATVYWLDVLHALGG